MSLMEDLDSLHQAVLKMCDVVSQNIKNSLNYYLNLSDKVELNDDLVDHYERVIEQGCISLLLKQRVYAADLKEVTGILKLVSDLERIGDYAEEIVKEKIFFNNKNYDTSNEYITDFYGYVYSILTDSIAAFSSINTTLATKIKSKENTLLERYNTLLRVIGCNNCEKNDMMEYVIHEGLISKYLERIGSHSINICEWVIYIKSGFYKDKMIL